eukprot:CAMPEP_0181038776 /NCGR_PEP_ID=MMETSP1070-20121207/10111_1 /TAXON_ID=265543 /ORGANISM="Minutocellus polymorphus, Strain NH13" /LENGTH=471 /DNA_ID=CAMNT_0023116573 /DNA_START=68 /DNA_END=1483 /DNA_ORIENTATION=-
MSKPFDYSKWDNIELSDDEDDVHPNIDRESWFRLKHRSRVEREEREEGDKKRITKEMEDANRRIAEIQRILTNQSKGSGGGDGSDSDSDDDDLEDHEGLQAELDELNKANKARQDKLDDYEKNKKWNVDNICHVVEERTIVNQKVDAKFNAETGYAVDDDNDNDGDDKSPKAAEAESSSNESNATKNSTKEDAPTTKMDNLSMKSEGAEKVEVAEKKDAAPTPTPTPGPVAAPAKKAAAAASKTSPAGPDREKVAMMDYHDFTEQYADLCEEFMKIRDLDRSREFLLQHGNVLLQENASNYLLLATLEDEMNGYHEKMRQTARQSQIISNIAELAKSLQSHPGNVINPFFKRLEEKQHLSGFLEGVETFMKNIEKRAVIKRKEIDAEREREAKEALEKGEGVDLADVPREERLGPGGLDPVEVFESLPIVMQEAFESREVDRLKEALMQMSPEEAEMHMKRCVDSGLWNEG